MTREIIEGDPDHRAREGHRERNADRGSRGRTARGVQEDARRDAACDRRARHVHAATSASSRSTCPRTSRSGSSRRRANGRSPRSSSRRRRRESGRMCSSPTRISTIDLTDVPEDVIKREDVTPDDFGRIAAQTAKQVILQRIREAEREMMYEEYIDRVSEVVTGHRPAGGRPQQRPHRPRQGRGAPAALRAGGRRALRAGQPHQGRDHRGALGYEGAAGDSLAARPGADPDAVRARGPGDRRRSRRDPRGRARARLPLEDRRRVARPGRRPRRRLRRPARLARADGRLRAARREDRHHPVEHRAGAIRRQGALAGPRPRGLHRRRDPRGDGDRPRRPARARDRQGGPERPSRRTALGLEGRDQVRFGVRAGGGRGRLRRRGRRRLDRSLHGDPLDRKALPERCAPGHAGSAAFPPIRSSLRARPAARTSRARSSSPLPRPKAEDDEPTEDVETRAEPRVAAVEERRTTTATGPRRTVLQLRDRTPIRSCVGCGRRAPQAELLRFVARDGTLAAGSRGDDGRGAYTCRRLACFERAVAQNAFSRTLRTRVTIDPELARLYTDDAMADDPRATSRTDRFALARERRAAAASAAW